MRCASTRALWALLLIPGSIVGQSGDVSGSIDTQTTTGKVTQRVVAGHHEAEKNRFLAKYLRSSPQEQVQLWIQSRKTLRDDQGLYPGARRDLTDVLIAAGTDAVPALAEVVHGRELLDRLYAVHILCDMDRFVRAQERPVHYQGASISFDPLQLRGDVNRFLPVDGRRIGKEGYETVRWAAEQTGNRELRFYARVFAGMLKDDLQRLTPEQQFQQWRTAIINSKGGVKSSESQTVLWTLRQAILEGSADPLPILVTSLETDHNSYVREGLVELLDASDKCRLRLRGTEVGQRAIQAIHKALEEGNLAPAYKRKELRDHYWKELSGQFFHDEFRLDTTSTWTLYAEAFDEFYDAGATWTPGVGIVWRPSVEAKPEMIGFITFLTNTDPNFPSWEYTFCGNRSQEVFHPWFKLKTARYFEQWRRYHGGQEALPAEGQVPQ